MCLVLGVAAGGEAHLEHVAGDVERQRGQVVNVRAVLVDVANVVYEVVQHVVRPEITRRKGGDGRVRRGHQFGIAFAVEVEGRAL